MSLAQKIKKKEVFSDFLNFKENWPQKACNPYVCIGNSLQKLQYLKI